MSFFKKICTDPSYCSFHDDTLTSLHITPEYIHIRVGISASTYTVFENDLKNVYHDPQNKDLYIDIVFFSHDIKDNSYLPQNVNFDEYYSVSSLERDTANQISLYFQRESDPIDYYRLIFSYQSCMAKPFAEMNSNDYNTHPELYNKPFDLQDFLKR